MAKDHPKHPKFAAHLKRLRLAAGLTRPALERIAEFPPNTVYMYETRKREPSIAALAVLAKALEVSPGKLLEGWP